MDFNFCNLPLIPPNRYAHIFYLVSLFFPSLFHFGSYQCIVLHDSPLWTLVAFKCPANQTWSHVPWVHTIQSLKLNMHPWHWGLFWSGLRSRYPPPLSPASVKCNMQSEHCVSSLLPSHVLWCRLNTDTFHHSEMMLAASEAESHNAHS